MDVDYGILVHGRLEVAVSHARKYRVGTGTHCGPDAFHRCDIAWWIHREAYHEQAAFIIGYVDVDGMEILNCKDRSHPTV